MPLCFGNELLFSMKRFPKHLHSRSREGLAETCVEKIFVIEGLTREQDSYGTSTLCAGTYVDVLYWWYVQPAVGSNMYSP